MNSPKVSIIVPIYNVEKHLATCIKSLQNQSLKDLEIILVDDESPDNCPKLCNEYAKTDSRIKVIHKKNEGLGFARNSGLNIAEGEFVSFLDSDDYIDLNAYEELYELAKSNNLDAIYYKFESFTDDGTVYGHNESKKLSIYESPRTTKQLAMEMIGSMPSEKKDRLIEMSACTAFYKRSLIDKYKISFHSERELISEDLIFNIDFLSHAKKVALIPRTYYHYYVNTTSLTRKVRFDRVEKNIIFYRYISNKLNELNNPSESDQLRAMRMLIGYCRNSILQVLKSKCSNTQKNEWLVEVCKIHIWSEIYSKYPIFKLPLKYALFFWAKRFKQYWLIRLMALIS